MDRKVVIALLLVVAASTLASLDSSVMFAQATPVVTVTVSNTTIYIAFKEIKVLVFNETNVRIGWLNSSFIRIAYFCVFSLNYSSECTPIIVYVYDPTTNVSQEAVFTNLTDMCNLQYSFCYSYADINVSNYQKIMISVVDAETNQTLQTFEVPVSPYRVYLPNVVGDLAALLPIALLIGLAGRGSLKGCAVGLIMYGTALMILPSLGFIPKEAYIASVAAIFIGALILYFTRS